MFHHLKTFDTCIYEILRVLKLQQKCCLPQSNDRDEEKLCNFQFFYVEFSGHFFCDDGHGWLANQAGLDEEFSLQTQRLQAKNL